MADPKATTAQAAAAADTPPKGEAPQPAAAAAATPKPDPGPGEMIPKAKYDELSERVKEFEKTLKAIEKDRTASPAARQQAGEMRDVIGNIAGRIGATKEVAAEWDKFLTPFLEEKWAAAVAPYVQTLAAVADKVHAMEARATLKNYDKYADEIEGERQTRMARGEYLPHEDAYQLVRSRHLDELLEDERRKAAEDLQQRSADAASMQGDAETGVQKAGPTPLKTTTPLTRADFEKMPLADKERYLETLDAKF